jgi:hypothetical protein
MRPLQKMVRDCRLRWRLTGEGRTGPGPDAGAYAKPAGETQKPATTD